MNWDAILEDDVVFSTVISDLVKRGPFRNRTAMDNMERFNIILYGGSKERFVDSLYKLTSPDGPVKIAEKTGYSLAHVKRIMSGKTNPNGEILLRFSEAYDVEPSYFLEYRVFVVTESIENYLMENPDVADSWYRSVRNAKVNS